MSGKTSKQFYFEVTLNWLADTRGILTAKDAEGCIHVAMPPEFGGKGKPWTAEHLLLSAVSSGFMTTYLAFARKLNFEISGLKCHTIGHIEISDGRYKFTQIDVFPEIIIAAEEFRDEARQAVEKTHQHCLITNTLNTVVFFHSEIKTSGKTGLLKNDLYEHTNCPY